MRFSARGSDSFSSNTGLLVSRELVRRLRYSQDVFNKYGVQKYLLDFVLQSFIEKFIFSSVALPTVLSNTDVSDGKSPSHVLLFNSELLHFLGLEAFNTGSETGLSPFFLFSTSYTSLLNVTQLPPDQQARTNTTPSDERAVLSE